MLTATRLIAVTFALLLAAVNVPRLTRAEPVQGAPPAVTADAAVRQAVEAQGGAYAGDCAAAVSPGDVGKVCSRFIAEQSATRAYLIGRTFSEFSAWVFVAPAGDSWMVAGTAPLDFFGGVDVPWP